MQNVQRQLVVLSETAAFAAVRSVVVSVCTLVVLLAAVLVVVK